MFAKIKKKGIVLNVLCLGDKFTVQRYTRMHVYMYILIHIKAYFCIKSNEMSQ